MDKNGSIKKWKGSLEVICVKNKLIVAHFCNRLHGFQISFGDKLIIYSQEIYSIAYDCSISLTNSTRHLWIVYDDSVPVRSRYIASIFLRIAHDRHHIARSCGRGMGCRPWVQIWPKFHHCNHWSVCHIISYITKIYQETVVLRKLRSRHANFLTNLITNMYFLLKSKTHTMPWYKVS